MSERLQDKSPGFGDCQPTTSLTTHDRQGEQEPNNQGGRNFTQNRNFSFRNNAQGGKETPASSSLDL
jgi:hypothetical protein